MNIEEKLTASIISAINMLYGQEVPAKMVQLQKTKKEFEGHLTLVVFPFLKMSKALNRLHRKSVHICAKMLLS
jgi:arginyl-tRNA synthetase